MIEFYTRYTLEAPKGTISDAGIKAVTAFILKQDLTDDVWQKFNPNSAWKRLPELPNDWTWLWIVGSGEYRGTMPKRISAFYHKNNGIKCPPTFLQEVGNIARTHAETNVVYSFEFVNKIDWYAGDFGEHSYSCYWGANSGAREMIEDNGFAVRFYDEHGNGKARAWMADIGDNTYILWNGYGFENPTITIARVVSSHLGLSYKRIELYNDGSDGGTLYINGGAGYVIGIEAAIEAITEYDLEWEDIYSEHCESCGERVPEGSAYHNSDGDTYCQDCYYEIYDNCYHCGESYYREDLYFAEHELVCEYCLNRNYEQCDKCEQYVHNRHARHIKSRVYCRNCEA